MNGIVLGSFRKCCRHEFEVHRRRKEKSLSNTETSSSKQFICNVTSLAPDYASTVEAIEKQSTITDRHSYLFLSGGVGSGNILLHMMASGFMARGHSKFRQDAQIDRRASLSPSFFELLRIMCEKRDSTFISPDVPLPDSRYIVSFTPL